MFGARMFFGVAARVTADFNIRSKAFFAALASGGDVLDVVQKNALDRLVRDVSGEPNANHATLDYWAKLRALWPVIGGTATAHKWNLIDPRDLDAAYRLTFVGSPTHSATGIAWNGVNQYANTHCLPSVAVEQNSAHLSYYSRNNNSKAAGEIGARTGAASAIQLIPKYTNTAYVAVNSAEAGTTDMFNSSGFFISRRIDSGTCHLFRNGSLLITRSSVSLAPVALPVYIGAINQGGSANFFTDRAGAFASIGLGLTDAECLAFYNAVQAYQTALGRQV